MQTHSFLSTLEKQFRTSTSVLWVCEFFLTALCFYYRKLRFRISWTRRSLTIQRRKLQAKLSLIKWTSKIFCKYLHLIYGLFMTQSKTLKRITMEISPKRLLRSKYVCWTFKRLWELQLLLHLRKQDKQQSTGLQRCKKQPTK